MILTAFELLLVMTIDGREVRINPDHIVTFSEARQEGGQLTDKVHCIITLSNGKFVTVAEECTSLRRRLEGH